KRGEQGEACEKNVKVLQLAPSSNKINALVRQLLGKKVTIKGQLFHASSGHHHARVLMRVEAVKSIQRFLNIFLRSQFMGIPKKVFFCFFSSDIKFSSAFLNFLLPPHQLL